MKPFGRSQLLLWLGFVAGTLMAVLQAAEPARVVGIEGTVSWMRSGGAQWEAAQTNQTLQAGDRLRTGPDSRAAV